MTVFFFQCRRNSFYDCLKQLISVKGKLNTLLAIILSEDKFTEFDINYLKQYCYILKPVAKVRDRIIMCFGAREVRQNKKHSNIIGFHHIYNRHYRRDKAHTLTSCAA